MKWAVITQWVLLVASVAALILEINTAAHVYLAASAVIFAGVTLRIEQAGRDQSWLGLAITVERERCARIVESASTLSPADGWSDDEKTGYETGQLDFAISAAAAIRAGDHDG